MKRNADRWTAPVSRETSGSIERKLDDGTTLITDKFRPSDDRREAREADERRRRFGVACYYAEPTCHGVLTRPGCCDACEVDAHANGYRAAEVTP